MSRFVLVTLSLSLALAALLVTFAPFMRDFTGFHIGAEVLVPGAFTCGVLCGFSIIPPRLALISLALVLAGALLIQSIVIGLPALINLVPNPVSYVNFAEQQTLIGCFSAGPFFAAGGVLGGLLRMRFRPK